MNLSAKTARLLFKNMIDCFSDAVFYLNQQGHIDEINVAAQKTFALDYPSSYGQTLAQLLKADLFLNLSDNSCFKWSWNTCAGETIFSVQCRTMVHELDLPGLVVIFRDISDSQKMTEYINKLEETNRDLDVLFRFSHDGLVISDGNAIAVRYNEAYGRITGIDGKDLIGKHMEEILKMGFISESATLLALQTRQQVTTMPKLKNGKRVLITAIPVFDADNNIVKIICNVRDITELVALESQLDQAKELSERYYSELMNLRSQTVQVEGMIAESPAMRTIISTALKVAASDATVLITGESGSGKEVLARTIHNHSQRKAGPFVKVNCGSIPDTLMESELFGYEKGAFTNAAKTGKLGIFEIAVGGTLFLDEIGEIPLLLQAKLLGVLQDKKFTRVGGTKEIDLAARIIAATNRDLGEMIACGKFRKDLFYRLNVVGLKIPPLAQRREDIFPLAHNFLREQNEKYKFSNSLSPQVMNIFLKYNWPGNVREMENLMEQLVVLSPNEQIIPSMLPDLFHSLPGVAEHEFSQGNTLQEILANVQRRVFHNLVQKGYSSYKIAEELGLNQSTVIRKMQKLGLAGKQS
ncbi:MAG: sigma 54-interacting transcriptional regulator [Negativicutes bacterium]